MIKYLFSVRVLCFLSDLFELRLLQNLVLQQNILLERNYHTKRGFTPASNFLEFVSSIYLVWQQKHNF